MIVVLDRPGYDGLLFYDGSGWSRRREHAKVYPVLEAIRLAKTLGDCVTMNP